MCRLKQKVMELQTFRQQCGDLEQKVAVFMQEKEQFENEVGWWFYFTLFYTTQQVLFAWSVEQRSLVIVQLMLMSGF